MHSAHVEAVGNCLESINSIIGTRSSKLIACKSVVLQKNIMISSKVIFPPERKNNSQHTYKDTARYYISNNPYIQKFNKKLILYTKMDVVMWLICISYNIRKISIAFPDIAICMTYFRVGRCQLRQQNNRNYRNTKPTSKIVATLNKNL